MAPSRRGQQACIPKHYHLMANSGSTSQGQNRSNKRYVYGHQAVWTQPPCIPHRTPGKYPFSNGVACPFQGCEVGQGVTQGVAQPRYHWKYCQTHAGSCEDLRLTPKKVA